MTLKVYFDYKNQDSNIGESKHNGFDLEDNGKWFTTPAAWHVFPERIREDLQYVQGSEHGGYSYPIGFDWRVFGSGSKFINSSSHIKIPSNVVEDVKSGIAKILCINTHEGFCLAEFDNIIEAKILSVYGLDWQNFITVSGNCASVSPAGVKNIYHNSWEFAFFAYTNNFDQNILQRNLENIFTRKTRKNKFICLQRRPRLQRIAMYAKMYPYRSQGVLTLGVGEGPKNPNSPMMHDMFEKARRLFPSIADEIRQLLLFTLPRQYDVNVSSLNPVSPQSGDTDIQKYEDSYLHIVCETFFENNGDQMFFSEKALKPFIFLQPFVLFGQSGSLSHLRELGFKTCSPFIDETYDTIEDDEQRFLAAFKEVERIINLSDEELNDMLIKMSNILIHNYFNLKSRCDYAHILLDKKLNAAIDGSC